MIVVIDYGMGNLGSINNMLKKIGVESNITSELSDIETADKLILPGVGSFDKAMANLHVLGLIPTLNDLVLKKKRPIMGICLGMQLFSKSSEEGRLPGLGWIDAATVRFRFSGRLDNFKVPHMGWNTINFKEKNNLWENMCEEDRFYFVHSYHVKCKNEENVLATCNYGIEFHAMVMKDNIIGTQFHPEKSHKFGMNLFRNFVQKC